MNSVTAGTRLGPYEIVSRIGAGGMGEVWRAKDTRLDRSVAIKILPAQFAQNAQLKVRFEREAKAISQLSHPHICTLYDVGDDYLVMELLEGESLAERVARGPLPLSDVLRYGAEIADALDRAHRAGIIHRDLKPANVMITKAGAKLLDFGLAKAAMIELAGDGPTIQKDVTQEGTILGTFQYMAPEQLDGLAADARTDIFALGAVLYEMATGRRAFEGKTRTSIIAAIVSGQPQAISALQPVTPQAFEHVVQKCLEKDADARWQSAHDIAEELRWIATDVQRVQGGAARRGPATVVAAALLAVIAIASTALYLRERAKPEGRVAFAITPPPRHGIALQAISPDGRSVVMQLRNDRGEYGYWMRRIDELEPKKLIPVKAESSMAFWSPDSAWVGYFEDRHLKRIAAAGGKPETIAKDVGGGVGASWSRDGTILYAPRWKEGLFRVPASGGEPVRVTSLEAKRRETIHAWPQFLSDGQHFLYLVRTVASEPNEIYAGSLDGKTRKLVTRADSLVGLARSSLVYVRDGAMYAVPFDEKKLELAGAPIRIADGVAYVESNATSYATVSHDGAFVYFPAALQTRANEVGWYDRSGRLIERLFNETSVFDWAFSRDGTRAVMAKIDAKKGAGDVYTLDLARRIPTRVTEGLSHHHSVVMAADGSEVYFASDRDGMYDVYAQSEDGTTPARALWKSDKDKGGLSLTPDGAALLVSQFDPKTRNDVWLLPVAGGAPRLLIGTEANETQPRVSPDGRWLAYASDRSGKDEIYLRRFPNGRSIQVSTNGGTFPQWKFDSTEIFFDNESRLYAVAIRADGDTPRPAEPVLLFEWPRTFNFIRPSPTADRFLICNEPNPADNIDMIHYVSGWK